MDSVRRLFIVWNPAAGPTRPRTVDLRGLVTLAADAGWEVEAFESPGPGTIEGAVQDAIARGVSRVLVAGGDGSINESLQGIAGTPVELGILPAGTSNILSNELGLPVDLREAATVAIAGRSVAIDVGKANGRYFALMVGIGYDARITETIWPELKRRAGQVAYTVAGIQTFFAHRATRMRLQVDGRKLRRLVYFLVVANTRLYGRSNAMVADHADVRDGQFDLCIFRTRAWYHVIAALFRVLARRPSRFARVETIRCQTVTIRSARPASYQLDGDPGGVLPLEVTMHPRALFVVVRE